MPLQTAGCGSITGEDSSMILSMIGTDSAEDQGRRRDMPAWHATKAQRKADGGRFGLIDISLRQTPWLTFHRSKSAGGSRLDRNLFYISAGKVSASACEEISSVQIIWIAKEDRPFALEQLSVTGSCRCPSVPIRMASSINPGCLSPELSYRGRCMFLHFSLLCSAQGFGLQCPVTCG